MKNLVKKENLIIIGILIIFMSIGFFIRVYFPYDRILGGDVIKYSSIDAYYYMRLVDNIAYNFPHLTTLDPYFSFPNGGMVNTVHFFAVVVGFFAWLFSLGNVTPEIIDKVGVFVPPVMAILTVIPLFFIGKTLFNKWAGLLACCLFVILPGELMGRSILGFTDHHILEVLLSTTIIMCILYANKSDGWKRFLVYSFSAGIILGVYLLTWSGGMLLVALLALYVFIQYVVNQYKHQNSTRLFQMSFILFAVGYLIYSQIKAPVELQTVMALIPVGIIALHFGGKLISRFKFRYYAISIVVLAVGMLLGIKFVNPDMWTGIMGHLSAFIPNSALTTIEAQPIFSPVGEFTTQLVWGGFTTCIFILPIPLGMIIWKYYKSKDTNLLLLIVFSLGMFWAMVAQRRFSYYMAIFVSILIGYFSWRIVAFVNEKFLADRRVMKKRRKQKNDATHLITVGITISILLVGFYLPNYLIAKQVASQSIYNPSAGWQESLEWMRDNTPKPLEDDDYYKTFDADYEYPDSAYGILSWWDYGYWITRIAHRIPYVNPSQEAIPVEELSELFLSQEAQVPIDTSDYIILDYAITTDKIHAVIKWAGKDLYEYFDTYYIVNNNEVKRVWLYYPEYYQSLAVRLYNFEGKKVDNIQPIVIRYIDGYDDNGNYLRQIIDSEMFQTVEEAQEFIDTREEGAWRLVGVNRFVSPVPLEELEGYELVHSSDQTVKLDDGAIMPEIKIFKYGG